MVEPGSGRKWFRSFSEIVSDILLAKIEKECDAQNIKMTFPERANEVERRMVKFAAFLYGKYMMEG